MQKLHLPGKKYFLQDSLGTHDSNQITFRDPEPPVSFGMHLKRESLASQKRLQGRIIRGTSACSGKLMGTMPTDET